MDILAQFKNYLLSQKNQPSKVTVKNYLSDINHFIKFFEDQYKKAFSPSEISFETIRNYKTQSASVLSESSLDRHMSSLRKFFYFLKLEGYISSDPFKAVLPQPVEVKDPWHIKEFKNYLYVFNASNLTIKNYIIDIRQFLTWAETVTPNSDLTTVGKINKELIEEYKQRLITHNNFSATTVNRKLSSLRKYLSWAQEEGFIKAQPEVTNYQTPVFTTQPEAISQELSKIEEPRIKNYSWFPPLRVAQKMGLGFQAIFDKAITETLAKGVRNAEYIAWKVKGKHVFTEKSNEIKAKIPDHNFLRVSNIKKEFYAPLAISTANLPSYKKYWIALRYKRPNWYKTYHSYPLAHYLNFAVLIIIMAAIGFGFYTSFFDNPKNQSPILAAAPVAPPRILSFQGRLTDSNDNPITSPTWLRFGIYTSATASDSGTTIFKWQETDYVSPDTDGIFNVLLGQNSVIPPEVFTQNSALWLGVTVGQTAELTPRQPLATVAYATNAETLQGMYPTTATTSATNVILALDSSGNLSIGGTATPTFQATGGQFKLLGQPLVLGTNVGSNANVTISPDGLGKVDLQKPLQNSSYNNNISTAQGAVEVDDMFAVLATSSGQSAVTINQGSTGPIISASASGVAKFTVDASGNVTAAGNGIYSGTFTVNGNTLSIGNGSAATINTPSGNANLTIAPNGTGGLNLATTNTGNVSIGNSTGTITLNSNTTVTSGKTLTLGGITGNNAVLYATTGTGVVNSATTSTSGQCLISGAGAGYAPSWGSCSTGNYNFWQELTGALSPINSSDDLLIGGSSTASAEFAFTGLGLANHQTQASFSGQLIVMPNNGYGGNVGIGTNTPAYTLDVTGTGHTTGAFTIDAGAGSANAQLNLTGRNSGTANNAYILANYQGGVSLNAATSRGFVLSNTGATYSNTGAVLEVSGSQAIGSTYVTTAPPSNGLIVEGNVGIGTAAPQVNLDVFGTQYIRDNGTLASVLSGLKFVPSGGINYIESAGAAMGAGTGADLRFTNMNATSTWMTIQASSGNVGIGTTNPGQLLTVGPNSSNGQFTVNTTGAVASVGTTGQVFFTGHQVGSGYSYGAPGIFQAITDNLTGANNTYFQGVTGSTTNFSVRADGQGYFAGNVGIGTNNPVAQLDVRNGAVFKNSVSASTPVTPFASSSAEFLLSANSLVTIGESVQGNANPAITLYRTTSGNRIGTGARLYLASSNFDFRIQQGTNGTAYGAETYTDRLTINSSGYVGIGNSNSAALFSVGSSSNFQVDATGAITTTGNGLSFTASSGDTVIKKTGASGILDISSNGGTSAVRFNYDYGGGTGGIQIYDGATTNNVQLLATSGNLAIAPSGGTGSNVAPTTNQQIDLGDATHQWRNIYGQNIYSNGVLLTNGGAGFWQELAGALSPVQPGDDLLIGGSSTASADFAFTGLMGNQTQASFSGQLNIMPNKGYGGGVNSYTGYAFRGTNILSAYGTSNIFVGGFAGNPTASGYNTAVGTSAGTNLSTGTENALLGYQAGVNLGGGTDNVLLGAYAGTVPTVGNNNTIIGAYADMSSNNLNYSLALGYNAIATGSNQAVIGGNTGTSYIQDFYLGNGVTTASPRQIILHASGGSGTNVTGANLTLASGISTGNAAGGNIYFMTSTAGVSGVNPETLSTRLTIDGSGNITMSGTGNFATGTGTVSLNGNTTIPTGKTLTLVNNNGNNAVLYSANSTGLVTSVSSTTTAGQCLLSGSSIPAWGSCPNLGGFWQELSGALSPVQSGDDLLIGGSSTASADFAFTGLMGNQTQASFSGQLIVTPNKGYGGGINVVGNDMNSIIVVENDSSTAPRYPSVEVDNYTGSTTGQSALILQVAKGTKAAPTIATANSDVTTLVGRAYNGTSFKDVGRINFGTDAAFSATDQSGYIGFMVGNGATYTEKMRLDHLGNLGLGISAPLATLDVRGSSATTPIASFSGTTSGPALGIDSNTGAGDLINASSGLSPALGRLQFKVTNLGSIYGRSFTDLDNNSYFLDPAASGTSLTTAGAAGIGTYSITGTTTKLDVAGGIGLFEQGIMSGWTTTTGGGTYTNQYFPIASVSIPAQYGYGTADILISKQGAAGSQSDDNALVHLQVKQQTAFGSPPIVSLQASYLYGIKAANIVFVLTSYAGPTTGTLYIKNPTNYEEYTYTALSSSGSITIAPTVSAPVASLPTGTQTNPTYAFYSYGGNMGIGTDSPASPLHIYGNSSSGITGEIQNTNSAGYAYLLLKSDATQNMGVFAGGTALASYGGANSLNIFQGNNAPISFLTGGTNQRMVITGTGDVGIGITAPNDLLDVSESSTINVTTPGLATTYGIHLTAPTNVADYANGITFGAGQSSSGNTAQAGIYVQSSGAYGTKMYFATTNSFATGAQTRMMIDHLGNIGVNVTSPTSGYKMDVFGGGGTNGGILIEDSGSNPGAKLLQVGDDSFFTDIDVANTLGLYGNSNSAIASLKLGSGGGTITGSSGNIGIGNTSPAEDLSIGDGTANSNWSIGSSSGNRMYMDTYIDAAYLAINRRSSDGAFARSTYGAASIGFVSDTSGGYFDFNTINAVNTNPTLAMRINESHYVGMYGQATGATNSTWLGFYDSGGTRIGYVGDGSTSNSDMYLVADTAGALHLGGNGSSSALNIDNSGFYGNVYMDPSGSAGQWVTVVSSSGTAGQGGLRWTQNSTYYMDTYLTGSSATSGKLMFERSGSTALMSISLAGVVKAAGTITGSTTPDYAETIRIKDQSIEAGDIVSAKDYDNSVKDIYQKALASKTDSPYSPDLIGGISESPGILIDTNFESDNLWESNERPLTVAGRIPVKVTAKNGPIKVGDLVTSSEIPGVGMKATKAGMVVGTALTDFDPSSATQSARLVNGQWQISDSTCTQNEPDCFAYGKILVFIKPGFMDPQVYLTSTGNMSIVDQATTSADFTVPHYYSISDALGNPIDRVGAFAQLAVANLRAGVVNAQQIIVNGQNLGDYIATIVNNIVGQNPNGQVVSPIASDSIKTNLISPTATDSAVALRFENDKLSVLNTNNSSGSAVATIDNQGNASFSGKLTSNQLDTNDASISGTLHVGKIIADQIVSGSSSATYVTNITNVYNSTPSSNTNFGLVNGSSTSTSSGTTNQTQTGTGYMDISSMSGQLSYVPTLSSQTATFSEGLTVFGPSSLSDVSITGQVAINGSLILANNSINVLGSDFNIQPLKQGGVSIMAGLVYIDTNGNVTFGSDVQVKGTLYANAIAPIPGNDLAINLASPSGKVANLNVTNATGSSILSLNGKSGDLTASGAGTFAKLNLSLIQPAQALSETEITATGSAGTAWIAAHQKEVTIDNSLVTDKSLIYITPTADTKNQVIYLIRQVAGQSFTVGLPDFATSNIPFNWIIVN